MRQLLLLFIGVIFLNSHAQITEDTTNTISNSTVPSEKNSSVPAWINISRDVKIKDYFAFIDSVTTKYDSLINYPFTEHLLVRANPWIIDTLANTDYYRMIARDSFVYDQREMIVIKSGDSLRISDTLSANRILQNFKNTTLDINIPEYTLRIFRDSIELYSFPIRVGQHRKRYLAMADGMVDLRTKTGSGTIVRHERDPDFYNPVNGKQFYFTKRDDQKTTVMPLIPWIETEIDGMRNGQMIHPTTNPETLGKAYSNGCIGTKEADAWIIYYYAPLETPIQIRYQLNIVDKDGLEQELEDVYGLDQ